MKWSIAQRRARCRRAALISVDRERYGDVGASADRNARGVDDGPHHRRAALYWASRCRVEGSPTDDPTGGVAPLDAPPTSASRESMKS